MCGTLFKSSFSLVLAVFCLVAGCACPTFLMDRYSTADRVAQSGGFKKLLVKTKDVTLMSYCRFTASGQPMNLYIEGDGSAWLSRTRLSNDPTPQNPLVLELARQDPAASVAYLARPGQYIAGDISPVDPAWWSDRRFSNGVVAAMNEAIDILLSKSGGKGIHLVGYSGGAALAVLIASGRTDVKSLRTVAGNLDPDEVNRYHRVSPLEGSLNPMDVAESLRDFPQRHFVGSGDTIIPPSVARSFVKRTGRQNTEAITVVEGATHTEGWREKWRSLLTMPPQ
jgi:hypothetical protein